MKNVLFSFFILSLFSNISFANLNPLEQPKKICISYHDKKHHAEACVDRRCVLVNPSSSVYLVAYSGNKIAAKYYYYCHHYWIPFKKVCRYYLIEFFTVDGKGKNGVTDKETIIIKSDKAHIEKSDKCSS